MGPLGLYTMISAKLPLFIAVPDVCMLVAVEVITADRTFSTILIVSFQASFDFKEKSHSAKSELRSG